MKNLDLIILAAGRGKRMRNYKNIHKTLLDVDRYSLLENHIINGAEYLSSYLNEIFVVVGHRREEIENRLYEIERNFQNIADKIKIVNGNLEGTKYGRSLLNALFASKNESILYVMGDHWIDYSSLKIKYPIKEVYKQLTSYDLVIFSDPDPLIANIKSQSLILYNPEKDIIEEYGKHIDKFTHVDMGLFLANREKLLSSILKNRLNNIDFDTRNLIEVLGKRVGIIEIEDIPWFGCNTPEDYESGLKKLYHLKNTK